MAGGKHAEITEAIIGAIYDVYNTLGYGFSERVYENSLRIELEKRGLAVHQQYPIKVRFHGEIVGEYYADLLVEDAVVVELKATPRLICDYQAQLLNYLKATRYEVGLLLNFGPRAELRRQVYDNARKGNLSWAASLENEQL